MYAEYVVKYTEDRNYRKCYYNCCFLIIYLMGSCATSSVEPLASPCIHHCNPQSFNTTQQRFDFTQGYKKLVSCCV